MVPLTHQGCHFIKFTVSVCEVVEWSCLWCRKNSPDCLGEVQGSEEGRQREVRPGETGRGQTGQLTASPSGLQYWGVGTGRLDWGRANAGKQEDQPRDSCRGVVGRA